ncbi:hippocalcin-like protein 1 isoform X2 [Mercenaria mercenaria]|nr:hippocalcin-like protein 1 isoform X2 [Mercenaria mercenaria]
MTKGITKLTVDVFKKVYNRVFEGDASSFAYHLFRSFDMNGDGYVDFREFIIGLSVSGSDNPDKKLKWAFRMYDIDGNGRISKNEMNCILRDIYKMTNAMVSDELGSPEQITDKFFTKFDLDGDGQISFQEFKNGALTDPLIIHLLECDPDP